MPNDSTRIAGSSTAPIRQFVYVSSPPVLPRHESSNIDDLDLLVWDNTNYRAIGKTISELGLGTSSGGTYNEILVTSDDISGIPIIINAFTGQTADLQQWKINGTTQAEIDSNGRVRTVSGISNLPSSSTIYLPLFMVQLLVLLPTSLVLISLLVS